MSKSKSSELVRGAGMAASVWIKFEEAIKRNHGCTKDLHMLAQPEGDAIIDNATNQLAALSAIQRNAYIVPVNHDLSHPQQIEEGNFDWIDNNYEKLIWKNPTSPHLQVKSGQSEQYITELHLGPNTKTHEVLSKMDKLNVRPTLSHETLAFAATHPDVQRKFPLVGLGSLWFDSNRHPRVLVLRGNSDLRFLNLYAFSANWSEDCRFLTVRK